MKSNVPITVILIGFSSIATFAQTYEQNWSTLSGGGNPTSGGNFSLQGTVGLFDANSMTGSEFSVDGGFWPGVTTFQSQMLPILSVRFGAGNNVTVSWPNAYVGFVPQQTINTSSQSVGWVDVVQPPVVNGANKELTLPATGQFRVFRLRHP